MGTITIKEAKLYHQPNVCCDKDTLMKFGYAKCEVILYSRQEKEIKKINL